MPAARGRERPRHIGLQCGAGTLIRELLPRRELPHDSGNIVFLKESNRSNACGAGFDARFGVFHRDPSQGKHGDLLTASVAQSLKARGD